MLSKSDEDFIAKITAKGGYNHADANFKNPEVLNMVERRLKCPF